MFPGETVNTDIENPHVFASYSRRDGAYVGQVVQALKERKVSCFLDVETESMSDRPFLDVLHSGLQKARMTAVFIGAGGLGRFQRLEVNAAIINSVERGLRVVPVLIPGAGEIPQLDVFLQCFTYMDLRGVPDLKCPEAVIQLDKLARLCLGTRAGPGADLPRRDDLSLAGILQSAKRRVIISGHTLDRFTNDIHVEEALIGLVRRRIPITILQLNPACSYAQAHRPFHELESQASARDQHERTERYFAELYHKIDSALRINLDISYSPYMPRSRTVIADDAVFTYLYMYGSDVSELPDLCFESGDEATDHTRRKILHAMLQQIFAPETVPFIRCGQIFPQWREHHVAKWHDWSTERRMRHKLTHNFYVNNARVFDGRHGEWLEAEVREHIGQTNGRTLVVGCGSGKEVQHILQVRPNDSAVGVDFSHVAVALARERCGSKARIDLCDFYDLALQESVQAERFDSVIANAAFVHLLSREDLDGLLQTIHERLNPNGVLFLRCLYKDGVNGALGDELDNSRLSIGGWDANRWFVYYSRDELVRRCQKAGFVVDDRATEKIAKAREAKVKTVMEKGFRHAEFPGVYWPCVLARKKCPEGARS